MEKNKCSSCTQKYNKNLIKNYRPVSLLPISSKIYERVICNALFDYFKNNKLYTPSQSGVLPGNSCIAQLLSVVHGIQTVFDNNCVVDVRAVFLDISKAFDKSLAHWPFIHIKRL